MVVDNVALSLAGRAREELSIAASRLERSLASPRTDLWVKQVEEDLHDLRDALTRHIAITESDDGLLAQIVDDSPRLVPEVDIILAEHSELCEAVDLAADIVHMADPERIYDIRTTVLDLLGRLYAHRQHGADLVYDAYSVDIGGING